MTENSGHRGEWCELRRQGSGCENLRGTLAAVEDQSEQRHRLVAGPQHIRCGDSAGPNVPYVAETGHLREHKIERSRAELRPA
jgi:hypothetical protein